MLLDGWTYDASAYFGQSSVDYFINNTINPQLADMRTGIPTEYRPGANRQFEKTFNLDISKPFNVGMFYSPLNVAFGFEYHTEEFEIEAGEENSWYVDTSHGRVGQNGQTLAEQGFGVGSNGFTGFRPDFAGTFGRDNYALYMDLEAEVIRSLTIGLAGRYENFDGTIGETLNGKASARWQIVEMLALRGAISSGFRAPTPGTNQSEQRDHLVCRRKIVGRVDLTSGSPGCGVLWGQAADTRKIRQLHRRHRVQSGRRRNDPRLLPDQDAGPHRAKRTKRHHGC